MQIIQLPEELAHQAGEHTPRLLDGPGGDQRFDLVEEQDAGGRLLGPLEHLAETLLRLSHPLGQEARLIHRDQGEPQLARQGARQQGLPGPRGAGEEDALGRVEARVAEEGPASAHELDDGGEGPLDLGEAPDVLEGGPRALCHKLPRGRRLYDLEGRHEIVAGDLDREGIQLRLQVHLEADLRDQAAQGHHPRLLAKDRQVRPHVPVGHLGELVQVHIRAQRHPARMDAQDGPPPRRIRDADGDLPVEAPRPPQSHIHQVGHVGGPDDHHLPALHQAVHQRQELRHHPFLHVPDHHGPLGRQGVNLVQEDDAGGVPPRLLEDLAQLGLAFPVELVDDLGPVHVDEVGPDLVGDSTGDQRLACPGRPGEQDPPGRIDPQKAEDLGELQRQLDHLPDQGHFPVQAADVLVGDAVGLLRGDLGRLEGDGGVRGDEERAARHRPLHREGARACSQEGDLEVVPEDDGNAEEELAEVGDLFIGGNGLPGLDRSQEEGFRRSERDLPDGDVFVHAGLGIVPRGPIHQDEELPAMTGRGLGCPGHRGPPPRDHQDIPGRGVESLQIIRVEASKPLAHVVEKGLRHLKLQPFFSRLTHEETSESCVGAVVADSSAGCSSEENASRSMALMCSRIRRSATSGFLASMALRMAWCCFRERPGRAAIFPDVSRVSRRSSMRLSATRRRISFPVASATR